MIDPAIARKTWRTVEPVHGMIYFVPEGPEQYAQVGVGGSRAGYFASRSAALGIVPTQVVIATFFNFCPDLVHRSMHGVWDETTPGRMLEARLAAADAALRRSFGEGIGSPELGEAAGLARRAADAACEQIEGRPLFAAHASLPWPDEPHLVLWHAQTLLREHRGDGHIAALLLEGLSGIEALVIHAATGEVPAAVLRASRAWPEQDWNAAVERLQERGLVAASPDLALTHAGQTHRQWVEDRTDAASAPAYDVLGDDGCARLRALVRPFSRGVVEQGLLNPSATALD